MYRLTSTARIAARRTVARSQQRRKLATIPPSSNPDKKDALAAYGGNTALLVGGVVALAGIAWYMTRRGDGSPPSTGDMKRQARDLRDTAQAKTQTDTHDAKSRIHEEYDRARAGADAAVDKTRTTGRDLLMSAEQRATSARDNVVGKTEDARREVERETQKLKDTGNGWFNWGKNNAQDHKEDAVRGISRGAESVRVEADKLAKN